MLHSEDVKDKKQLRKKIRATRRALPAKKLAQANRAMINQLMISQSLLNGQHIALYIGNDGEICPRYLISILHRWKRKVYLPVLHPLVKNRMVFCAITPNTRFIRNRFGIVEPDFRRTRTIPARCLSKVLMPLVAFDASGNRMGMGGGFYDRTFQFKFGTTQKMPKLIGLAHEFQRVDHLQIEAWDVPMHAVATDENLYSFL